jgi:hypothetical protein
VEDRVGTGSTDFWGISYFALGDRAWADERGGARARDLAVAGLLAYFDAVAARVSPLMRKGPRGEDATATRSSATPSAPRARSFAKRVGLRIPERAALTPDGLRQSSVSYVAAMRAYNAGEVKRRMRSWTLPFLIRHSAYHTLDHAWEMEDKDLSAEAGV